MLTEDDHAKIVDFGLAKLMEPLGGRSSDSLEDTALRQTESGKILGTVSYMSPEQARGKTLDHRSDIFSFGIVLYEMVTGRLPFQGPSGVETLNAILKESAPPLNIEASSEDRDALGELERVIRRCLSKDPEDRYQTTKDLLSELRRVRRDSDSSVTTSVAPAASGRTWPRWLAGAGAVVGVLGVAAVVNFMRSGDAGVPRLTNPVQVTSAQGAELYPTWAPEGGRLAYDSTLRGLGNADIWVTQLSGGKPRQPDRRPRWQRQLRELVTGWQPNRLFLDPRWTRLFRHVGARRAGTEVSPAAVLPGPASTVVYRWNPARCGGSSRRRQSRDPDLDRFDSRDRPGSNPDPRGRRVRSQLVTGRTLFRLRGRGRSQR